eukprot:scaffold1585_cov284-Prasinococcus_capsulatus_cf.AAC.2
MDKDPRAVGPAAQLASKHVRGTTARRGARGWCTPPGAQRDTRGMRRRRARHSSTGREAPPQLHEALGAAAAAVSRPASCP